MKTNQLICLKLNFIALPVACLFLNISARAHTHKTISKNNTAAVKRETSHICSQSEIRGRKLSFTNEGLPVKVDYFNASINKDNNVDLRWATISEIDVDNFVIEKSTDGTNYIEVAVVLAYGNATDLTKYYFSDNVSNAQPGIIYYRIRTVNIDKKSQYSEIRLIRISKQTDKHISVIMYPNPVTNELRVTIPSTWQNRKVVYEILNDCGQSYKIEETTSSSQTETMNVAGFAPGLYVVRVTCNGESGQQKIIKQ